MTRDVVLATHNAHKVAELQRILGAELGDVRLVAYDGPEPVEDGVTFEENALIKARAAAQFTGLPALADDSGICVDILGGSPGIFSARWGGSARDASANLDLLLWQLSDVAEPHRGGKFACAAALVLPGGVETVLRRDWPGRILTERHGEHGFGYDPIFLPADADVSAAELSPAEKDARSHRTLAFTALAPEIRRLLGD